MRANLFEKKFIGVTGITNLYEAKEVHRTYLQHDSVRNKKALMFGIVIAEKKLNDRYVEKEELLKILEFTKDKGINFLHYSPNKEQVSLRDVCNLLDSIIDCVPFIDCLKINSTISIADIKALKKSYPNLHIALKVPKRNETENNTEAIDFIQDYSYFASIFYIDPRDKADVKLFHELAKKNFHFCIAGGTGPKYLEDTIKKLKASRSSFSTDVEAGIRDNKDRLDMLKLDKYIEKAKNII